MGTGWTSDAMCLARCAQPAERIIVSASDASPTYQTAGGQRAQFGSSRQWPRFLTTRCEHSMRLTKYYGARPGDKGTHTISERHLPVERLHEHTCLTDPTRLFSQFGARSGCLTIERGLLKLLFKLLFKPPVCFACCTIVSHSTSGPRLCSMPVSRAFSNNSFLKKCSCRTC